MTNSKELALRAAKILDEKGANNIEILEVSHLTSITDYFVIANGRNIQSVRSLAEDLEDKLTEESYRTTFDTDPEDLNLEAADVSDDEDY